MIPDAPHRFPARMSSLIQAMALLDRECAAHGVASADVLRLSLVLEELFTNTVHHGHGGDCDELVCMGWSVRPHEVVFHYADHAPPFDPLPRARPPTAVDGPDGNDLTQPAVGQLGLILVGQLTRNLRYAYENGWNILHLSLRRRA